MPQHQLEDRIAFEEAGLRVAQIAVEHHLNLVQGQEAQHFHGEPQGRGADIGALQLMALAHRHGPEQSPPLRLSFGFLAGQVHKVEGVQLDLEPALGRRGEPVATHRGAGRRQVHMLAHPIVDGAQVELGQLAGEVDLGVFRLGDLPGRPIGLLVLNHSLGPLGRQRPALVPVEAEQTGEEGGLVGVQVSARLSLPVAGADHLDSGLGRDARPVGGTIGRPVAAGQFGHPAGQGVGLGGGAPPKRSAMALASAARFASRSIRSMVSSIDRSGQFWSMEPSEKGGRPIATIRRSVSENYVIE